MATTDGQVAALWRVQPRKQWRQRRRRPKQERQRRPLLGGTYQTAELHDGAAHTVSRPSSRPQMASTRHAESLHPLPPTVRRCAGVEIIESGQHVGRQTSPAGVTNVNGRRRLYNPRAGARWFRTTARTTAGGVH